MKNNTLLIVFLLTFLMAGNNGLAQKLPNKKKALKAMELTNDYFMQKWPDPGAPIVHPDKTRPSNIWTRAVYYEGLMALYSVSPKTAYLNYAIAWGQKHNWGMGYNLGCFLLAGSEVCKLTK